jgi:hypothetical protein
MTFDCDIFEAAIHEPSEKYQTIQKTIVNTMPLDNTPFIAPFVACPVDVAVAALEFGRVNESDTLVDLGCGDGRILSAALSSCKRVPKKIIGVELDPHLYKRVKDFADHHSNIEIVHSDMFKVDIKSLNASVLVLYLLPAGLERLWPNLQRFLEMETHHRLVTIQYEIPDVKAACVTTIGSYQLFLYRSLN